MATASNGQQEGVGYERLRDLYVGVNLDCLWVGLPVLTHSEMKCVPTFEIGVLSVCQS